MKKLKVMLIDENMSAVEVELNTIQYRLIGIDQSKVIEHEKKRDLNVTITKYLDSFKDGEYES